MEDKTLTLIGIPYYSAPELILGESYGLAIDYWSMGVVMYEILVGGLPFGDSCINPYEIYELIINEKL